MSRLPILSGDEVIKILTKAGFLSVRQKGSHILMKGVYKNSLRIFPVPRHKELKKGTLAGVLRQAGMTVEEFREFI